MEKPFQFKQFSIRQDRCAMKVGTDGVLVGGWTDVDNNPGSILDIGAGTGLIALMLAQRTMAGIIDAIETDAMAFEQCVENFEASPWADRLFCYHASLKDFAAEVDVRYDLIVSNPPFFSEKTGETMGSRGQARQQHSLPFNLLLRAVKTLLAEQGTFSLILPAWEATPFTGLASEEGLYLHRICQVRGLPASKVKRTLMEFRLEGPVLPTRENLVVEHKRHQYTSEYIALTKEFYLKM
jgi:tRNA1Val (adenine37-N6)-methyltransferase